MRVMLVQPTDRAAALAERLTAFMDEHVYPNEARFHEQVREGDRWSVVPIVEELKAKARAAGLWNLFLTPADRRDALTNAEYAPLCEIMGRSPWLAPEACN